MSQRWSTDSRVQLHSARIIVDASIELMRAESFSNESSQVNLSENSNGLETWKVKIETETSALETETFGRSAETRPWIGLETVSRPRRDHGSVSRRSRDRDVSVSDPSLSNGDPLEMRIKAKLSMDWWDQSIGDRTFYWMRWSILSQCKDLRMGEIWLKREVLESDVIRWPRWENDWKGQSSYHRSKKYNHWPCLKCYDNS